MFFHALTFHSLWPEHWSAQEIVQTSVFKESMCAVGCSCRVQESKCGVEGAPLQVRRAWVRCSSPVGDQESVTGVG